MSATTIITLRCVPFIQQTAWDLWTAGTPRPHSSGWEENSILEMEAGDVCGGRITGEVGQGAGVMCHGAMNLARAKALKQPLAICGRTDAPTNQRPSFVASKQSHTPALNSSIIIWTWVTCLQAPRVPYSTSNVSLKARLFKKDTQSYRKNLWTWSEQPGQKQISGRGDFSQQRSDGCSTFL